MRKVANSRPRVPKAAASDDDADAPNAGDSNEE